MDQSILTVFRVHANLFRTISNLIDDRKFQNCTNNVAQNSKFTLSSFNRSRTEPSSRSSCHSAIWKLSPLLLLEAFNFINAPAESPATRTWMSTLPFIVLSSPLIHGTLPSKVMDLPSFSRATLDLRRKYIVAFMIGDETFS
ncbi:hypothetical protein OGAPHI_005981 [Ogataea philodendri]|uniref:Uncharacterized protein n=1 Tax=Ogataea philodendri TaxID=1378263 RepID=A0A9P8T0I4_9ASCO|nr:uncharacterized protein OGAPHI_005981 [Ogataea philodendri]KAH3661803.1 hypothetical protein OGAPHI_005981 [Ogataea philodendri]